MTAKRNCAAAIEPNQGGAGHATSADIGDITEFLSLVLDNVYSGIIVCDVECRIVFMNRVYGELLGVNPREAVGRKIEDFFVYSRLPQVLATGQAELGQRCSLKTSTPMLVNRIPLYHKGRTAGVILQTIFKDYQAFTDLLARLNLLEREVKFYKKGLDRVLSPLFDFDSIIGESDSIQRVKEECAKYARTDSPVLILGDTGTGKELFAHAVHSASERFPGPFVCVNCAAIPRELLESELFGYESGAFTGANKKGKVGKLQLAHRGTLYLDEIGELPLNAQAKLLRVLETKALERLGGIGSVNVDFRLVAATNRNLREMMGKGSFRDDLYYRLSTMTVRIPPLARRAEDIDLLVGHFLRSMDRPQVSLGAEAMQVLKSHSWPGNVRELKNVLERAVSLADADQIGVEHLPPELLARPRVLDALSGNSNTSLADELAAHEKRVLERTLVQTSGNMSKTSKTLKISRSTLYEKCRRHGLL